MDCNHLQFACWPIRLEPIAPHFHPDTRSGRFVPATHYTAMILQSSRLKVVSRTILIECVIIKSSCPAREIREWPRAKGSFAQNVGGVLAEAEERPNFAIILLFLVKPIRYFLVRPKLVGGNMKNLLALFHSVNFLSVYPLARLLCSGW